MSSSADCLIHKSTLSAQVAESCPEIAVALHLFYVDQLGLFLEQLANIQVGFDCFVSVGLGGVVWVSAGFQKLLCLRKLQIKEFSNVGRDMAPPFCLF